MSEITKNSISNKETKIKLNSASSRGSLISLNGLNQRKDIYGNPISKKIKNHKISFADEVGKDKKFVEIIVVNSYRDYHRAEKEGIQIFN
jgi:hypothetical protein